MHRMREPIGCKIAQKLDAARSRRAASRALGRAIAYPPTLFKNGIRFLTNAFLGLAELGSLCE